MKRLQVAKILSVIAMLSGVLVMVGWILDVGVLKSIHPLWITMKCVTAFSFVIAGLILFFVAQFEEGKREYAKVLIPILGFSLFLLMVSLLLAILVGMKSGIDDFFVPEGENAIKTITPGRSSVGTIINFIVISTIPFLYIFQERPLRKMVMQCGALVLVVGFSGLVGYTFNFPLLYYSMEGLSTAMAFHTALLFVLLGLGFILASQKGNKT